MLHDRKHPRWLRRLMRNVGHAYAPMFPAMQLRWTAEKLLRNRVWSLTVSPLPVEYVGGAKDGVRTNLTFQVDIEAVRHQFDGIVDLDWCNNACGFNMQHITFRGIVVSKLKGEDKLNRVELHCMEHSTEEEEEGVSCYVNDREQIRLPGTEEWFTPETPRDVED